MADIGPDRQVAWHVLGAVLRALRDRIPIELAAHFSAQLPILVRGAFYDQWNPQPEPLKIRSQDEFLQFVQQGLQNIRPVNVRDATICVFAVLTRHIERGQCEKVRTSLPQELQVLWHLDESNADVEERAALGRQAQNAREARIYESRPEGQRKAR